MGRVSQQPKEDDQTDKPTRGITADVLSLSRRDSTELSVNPQVPISPALQQRSTAKFETFPSMGRVSAASSRKPSMVKIPPL